MGSDGAAFRSGFVSIVGRPNVGKSTLLNALVGEKVAIISPRPQTTRNQIIGIKNGEGWQIVFVDTPGIHQPHTALGEYSWAALYQQRPVPAEGGLFKRAAFHIVPRAPQCQRAVRYWDLAMSDRTSADYTVGVKLGQTEAGRLVVLDIARAQLDWSSVPAFMAETALHDGPDVPVGFEEKGYMSRAGQELAQDARLHQFSIWGFPKDKDKLTNALPVAARVGQGLVDVVEAHWTWEFIDECCSFPAGEHDDQVDAFAGAYEMLGSMAGSASLTYADEYTIGAGDF